jgi:hypothetical protein
VMLLAALAGASIRGRPGRRRREADLATLSLTTLRSQRRNSRSGRWN